LFKEQTEKSRSKEKGRESRQLWGEAYFPSFNVGGGKEREEKKTKTGRRSKI